MSSNAVAGMLRQVLGGGKPLLCMTCDHALDHDPPPMAMIAKPFASRAPSGLDLSTRADGGSDKPMRPSPLAHMPTDGTISYTRCSLVALCAARLARWV